MHTGTENISMARVEEKTEAFEFIRNLLTLLLQYGANPNMVAGAGGSGRSRGQASYEQSRSAGRAEQRRGRQENVFIRRQTNNQDQVLFHYAQTLVNKDQLMADPEQSFARLIHLYYMSMKHKEVYNCLKVLSAQLSISSTKACQTLYAVIKDMNTKPRTLKQMCRVVVYNSVNQRPATTVAKLPLPRTLQDYILNFEP